MRPFIYRKATDAPSAVQALAAAAVGNPPTEATVQTLAGGTTLIDLMKLDVMRPETIVDINGLAGAWSTIDFVDGSLRLGALARMSDVAANPGSGCAALEGVNRTHAVLGTSEQCIATYPGDFAQALIALDAIVEIAGKSGVRTIPFGQLHKLPENSPHLETTLTAGELISGFRIPGRWPRSVYLKARDRQSYEFALSSAAIALDEQNGVIRDARVALGGVATVPWRAYEAEAQIKGKKIDKALAQRAAEAAFAGAKGRKDNGFKIELGRRVVAHALQEAARMEI